MVKCTYDKDCPQKEQISDYPVIFKCNASIKGYCDFQEDKTENKKSDIFDRKDGEPKLRN